MRSRLHRRSFEKTPGSKAYRTGCGLPMPHMLRPMTDDFERALEPVARRMERVKLPAAFLAELLREGRDVHLGEAAMRWAGMPNKNERAALTEALDALEAAGF